MEIDSSLDDALSDEIMNMSTDDIVLRTRLLDNECKVMRSGSYFIN